MNNKVNNTPFVIFLNIDGVLYNRPDQEGALKKAAELFPDEKNSNRICSIAASHFFNEEALSNLDHLINEVEKTTKVWIVISSVWREDRSVEELKTAFFGIHNFSKYIVDKTPEEVPEEELAFYCSSEIHSTKYGSQCRASEVQYWLKKHPEVIEFVVLGNRDYHLSDSFGEKFIQTKYERLLNSEISEKILTHYKLEGRPKMPLDIIWV